MTKDKARQMIDDAGGLRELLQALIAIENDLREDYEGGPLSEEPITPLCVRVDELVDVTSLPTYGGTEPDDTRGVWSWDAAYLLVGEGYWGRCTIVPRDNPADEEYIDE